MNGFKSSSGGGKNNNSRKKIGNLHYRLIRRFFLIVVSLVAAFTLVAIAGVFVYGVTRDDTKVEKSSTEKNNSTLKSGESDEDADTQEEVKTITNVAVFGVDKEELHTDVIFVVSFNSETKNINVLSIPRDTKVTMCDDVISGLESRNRSGFIPNKNGYGVCKINEVHAYAGEGYRNDYSVLQLEDLLGVDIDYYVKFTTTGFRSAIDAIGGVDFEVPQDMHYNDPEQGLYINLKAGMQHLNGDKAEQLVRFRKGYASQDLMRIQVQQSFMKALISQMINKDTIIDNIAPLTKTLLNCVETDVSVMDALKYVKYIKDINPDNMTMATIPGEGGSYYTYDKAETAELVQEMFFSKAVKEEQNTSLEDEPLDNEDSETTEN